MYKKLALSASNSIRGFENSIADAARRLTLALLFAVVPVSLASAQILIDYVDPNSAMHNASILNGGFEDTLVSTGAAGDRLTYAEELTWSNLATVDQTLHDIVRSNIEFESDQNGIVTDFADREAGVATGHTISFGEIYDFSYVWRDASAWNDAGDQVAFTLFTTVDDTLNGTRQNSYQFLSGTSTLNATYESVSGNFLSLDPTDTGKQLFVSLNGVDGGGGADGFARIDNVYLEASAAPANLFVWVNDADSSWNTGTNWNSNPTVPNAVDADVRFLSSTITAPRTVTVSSSVSANQLTFDGANQFTVASAAGQTLTLTESSGGAADATITTNSGTHEISGSLAGTVGFNKSGGGDLRLSGNNSGLSGGITVSDGSLRVNNSAGLSANSLDISSGSFVYLEGDGAGTGFSGTFNNTVTGDGEIRYGEDATTETITIGSGTSAHTGASAVRGGTVIANQAGDFGTTDRPTWVNLPTGELRLDGSGGAITTAENFNIGSRTETTLPHLTNSAGSNTITGNVTGTNGDGNHILSAASGTTLTINNTALEPAIVSDDNESGTFVFQGDGNIVIGNNATPGSGKLRGANVNILKQGSGTLTIATATTDPNDFQGGTTTIEAGTLEVLTDSDSGELASSVIQVQAGATFDVSDFGNYSAQVGQTFSGAGTIVANTLRMFDDSSLAPGDDGVGTLNVAGNMSLNSFQAAPAASDAMTFELGNATTIGSGVNDLLDVSGNLTVNVSGANTVNVNIVPTGTSLATGTYRLVQATGGSAGSSTSANFNVDLQDASGNSLGTPRQTLSVDPTTAGQLNLQVTGTALNLDYVSAGWNTAGDTAWDSTGNNLADSDFRALDNVNFDDGSLNKSVDVTADVAPASVTINNSAGNDYTFSGVGSIIGPASLTKSGTGTATLSNATDPNAGAGGNNFTGGIQVNGGRLVLDSDGANFSGGINIANGATLDIGASANGTNKNVLPNQAGHGIINTNASGSIRVFDSEFIQLVTGSGPLTIEEEASDVGDNTSYNGNITVKAGADLEIFQSTSLGTATGTTTVEAGGRLFVDTNADEDINSTENLTLAGFGRTGQSGNEGALQVGGTATHSFGGNITLSADARLRTGNAAGVMNVSGPVNGSVANASLDLSPQGVINVSGPVSLGSGGISVTASGTANLSGATTYSGDTNVETGTLALSGSASLSSSANVVVAEGATLDVQGIGTAVLSSQNLTGQGTVTGNLNAGAGTVVSPGGNTTVDVAVIQDLRIQEGDPNANFNNSRMATGLTNNDGLGRSLVEFDILNSLPAGATVLGGDLLLNVGFDWAPAVSQNVTVNAHELNTTFVEGEATWNSSANGVGWTTPGGDFNATVLGDSGTVDPDAVNGNSVVTISGTNLDNAIVANAGSTSFDLLLKLDDASEAADPNTMLNAIWYNTLQTGNPDSVLRLEIVDPTSTLTIDGDYIQDAGATLDIDLGGTSDFDLLDISGTLTAGGTLDVDLVGGFTPVLGNQFDILNFTSASGSFVLDLPSLGGGLTWDTSDLLTTGIIEVISGTDVDLDNDGLITGLDFLLIQQTDPSLIPAWESQYGNTASSASVSAVPEPSSLLLLVSTSMALMGLRNRSK